MKGLGKAICFIIIMMTVFALVRAPGATAAETGGASLDDWTYETDADAGTVTLTKYIGTPTAVVIPACFEIDGQTFATVLKCGTVFRANTNVKSVTIGGGVSFLNNSMRLLFGECSSLTTVDLSAVDTTGVTDMSYMFYKCGALKSLDLSSFDTSNVTSIRGMFSECRKLSGLTGYERWNTSRVRDMYQTFNRVAFSVAASTPVTIDLGLWDLSDVENTGWCFQTCRATYITVPENIGIMSAGFMNHAIRYPGTTYTIPAGVKKIGYAHTFYDFATDDFIEFKVAEGNTAYKAVDGVLYSADGKEMLAVPRNKPFTGGVFTIPEGVDFLGELSFSRNYNIHTVVLPDSYEIKYVPIYDERYIVYNDTGNLNAGSNLSIAIYCYTGITDYAVKETNPRYSSKDGLIYSKDLSHLVAVPARYNKTITLPEGVTEWDLEAMWADGSDTVDGLLSNCPGAVIPSSLRIISDDQFEMLNRLRRSRASEGNPFTITTDGDNEYFYLDGEGYLTRVEAGDVNGDGLITISDLASLKTIMAGSDGAYRVGTSDVNRDGLLTLSDIAAIKILLA